MLRSTHLQKPVDHARWLHPTDRTDSRGLVTIARHDHGHWVEQHVTVEELPGVVESVAGMPDAYISQNRFWGPRKITHLRQLDSLWADLDYHHVPMWQDHDPIGVLQGVLETLQEAQLPEPSFAVATGRGLALVWLHDPVPRSAMPRWNTCQKTLYAALRPFGADRMALDAARVLRLVGTRHARTGRLVEALTPVGRVWPFDALADEILPLSRGMLSDLRVQRALRRAERGRHADKPARQDSLPRFTLGTLWEGRLSDLQALLRLRWQGQLPSGQRDLWLFLAVVAMSWLAPPTVLYREAWALAKQAGGWEEREASARLQAIFRRADRAARGDKVMWQGHPLDPRYRFTNATMIEWLAITPTEQREMRVLIDAEEARRRERLHREAQRRAAGVQSRNVYLAQAADRRVEARLRRARGESVEMIAKSMKVNRSTVWRWLNG